MTGAQHLRPQRRRRRWPFAVVAAVVVVAVSSVAVARVRESLSQARDATGTPAEEETQAVTSDDGTATADATTEDPSYPLAALFDAGEVSSIELIGDSITAGYGTDGYVSNDADQGTQVICSAGGTTYYETPTSVRCWANEFRAYAAVEGVTSFVNRGICGWTMHDLATYAQDYVTDADVIVCMLGTNDTVNHPLETFRQDTVTALAYLARHCRLLVVMTPPVTDLTKSGYTEYFTPQETAEVLDDVCDEAGYLHISLLDVIQLDTGLVNADDIHPTTAGSEAIWQSMRTQLGLV